MSSRRWLLSGLGQCPANRFPRRKIAKGPVAGIPATGPEPRSHRRSLNLTTIVLTSRPRVRLRYRYMRLAGATDQHHIALAVEEAAAGELVDQLSVDRRGAKLQVGQFLDQRQLSDS